MTPRIAVSKQAARRFVLGKQGLWPGRRWVGEDGTRSAMHAVEYLQLDPLQILARSHDLMLHARVADYRPEFFGRLTYERREFFDWGHWLAVRPMEELPYWRTVMRREQVAPHQLAARYKLGGDAGIGGSIAQHETALDTMRAVLRERETVSAKEFAATANAVTNYRGGKDTSVALYYLWITGEAMTHHREGFERIYAAAERVAPPHLLQPADDAEADRYIVRKSIAFGGIGRLGVGRPGSLSRWLSRPVSRAELQRLERELVERGELVEVDVEGWRGNTFVLAGDIGLLAEVECGHIPAAWTPVGASTDEEVAFLSPLDPVSARGRAKELFDFDYTWEIYMRLEQMKYGRYTLPILWGDRLVGRIDPKIDRKAGTLVINGVWFEDAETARDEQFLDALARGLTRLMTFLGADCIDASAIVDRRIRSRLKRVARQ